MGAPPPRSKAFPWLWESSCYREGMGQAWWQTPQGALLPPSHGPCWGTWGYQRPRGSRHVSVPPRGFGACRHFHSPHNTARGCYRPIGCASAITRKNQKALSLACPFLQFPSSQWPAQCTHSPRPLQRPLTQPLASPDSATGRGLAALRLGAWWLSPGVHLLSTLLPLHLEPWLLPSSAFQALSSCQLPWGLG